MYKHVHTQAFCSIDCTHCCFSSAFADWQTSCIEPTSSLSTEVKLLCRSASCIGCLQAQVEAAVKAHVQLASAGTDEMATTSCAHARRLTPARQDRTAEVTAKHAKRVTFAATPPNKASVAHVATTVTGAKPGILCSCNAIWCVAID